MPDQRENAIQVHKKGHNCHFICTCAVSLNVFFYPMITEGAEEKIHWPPRDYVKAAGSSIHPSFKNSNKDITVSDSDTNVQGSSEGQPQQFPFTFFTVASLQQHTNSFNDKNLIRETCFGKIYLADHPGSKVTLTAKTLILMPVSSLLIVTFSPEPSLCIL